MTSKGKPAKKAKPTPKNGLAGSQKEHPAGLWMDPEVFARMNGRTSKNPHKETFEVSNRYLELAALVLGPEDDKKTRPAKSKRTNKS